VQVLPHPAYLDVYPPGRSRARVRESLGIPGDAFVYLAFGHIRAYKELAVLLQAFARLPVGARLIVAGKPIDRSAADQVRAAAAADPRIVPLLEFIPDSSVAELFAAADCAVVARSDGGTSGAIVLALSLGVPVVADAAYADVVDDAGWLATTPGTNGLATALAQAAADPDVADRAAAASRRVASWTWEAIGGRIADILEEACADGR
jgi:glycosyltransferase involved in cell wall biosynthesis